MRLDQWLWAVRLYRTRTLAADAVRKGHVRVGGQSVKPARGIKAGDVVTAHAGSVVRTYRVLGHPPTRVGAPGVAEFAEDLTPPTPPPAPGSEFMPVHERRPRGAGRPTKRDRRALDHGFSGEE